MHKWSLGECLLIKHRFATLTDYPLPPTKHNKIKKRRTPKSKAEAKKLNNKIELNEVGATHRLSTNNEAKCQPILSSETGDFVLLHAVFSFFMSRKRRFKWHLFPTKNNTQSNFVGSTGYCVVEE